MTAAPKRGRGRSRILGLSALIALTLGREASAGGLYLSDRGVRANGRGGAFVAGADDADAMWYNPAGLNEAGRSFFVDFMVPFYSASFQRRTRIIDASGNPVTIEFPKVEGSGAPLPMPMVAATFPVGEKKELVAGFSISAPFGPYSSLVSFPETLNGKPSPSRYSVVSMDGSLLGVVAASIAFKPAKWLELGAGVQLLMGTFSTKVIFNANPNDRFIGAPEDPSYDAPGQLTAAPILAPSANIGATIIPATEVRIGISAQAPYIVNAPGTIQVRLPNAPLFDNARQVGEEVRVKFNLPAIFRIGVEVRPVPRLRVEAAIVREQWTTHHTIDVVSKDVTLYGVTGFPQPFRVGGLSLQRQNENANSYRLGGEYRFDIDDRPNDDPKKKQFTVRAGFRYEESAVPVGYVSPLTIDTNKAVLSVGAGLHLGEKWRFDAAISTILFGTIDVPPEDARVPKVNPVKGNETPLEAINGGTYTASAWLLGLGLNYKY